MIGDDESISAGVSVFGPNYDPVLEGEFQHTLIAGIQLEDKAGSTNGQFADGRDLTFTVTPGENFFVLAFLSANALFTDCCSEDGVADASHTFSGSFSAGDLSLLSPLPEPWSGALVLLGAALALSARRR